MPDLAPGRQTRQENMATLFRKGGSDRKGDIWYIGYSIDGKRHKLSTGTANKKLAEVKLNDLKLKLFKGELGVPESSRSSVTVAEFFRRFKDYAHANYSTQHLQSDISRIDALQDFFARKGVKYLRSITPGVIEEFMTLELTGRSPKTRKNYLALLKTMLNYAVKWNVLDRNPISGVKPPKIVKKFHFFSKAEVLKAH